MFKNGDENSTDPELFTRLDWTLYKGDLFVCFTKTDAADSFTAFDTRTAVRANPTESGCGDSNEAWTRLKDGSVPFNGSFTDFPTFGGGIYSKQKLSFLRSSFYFFNGWVISKSSVDIVMIDKEKNYFITSNSSGKYGRTEWSENDGIFECSLFNLSGKDKVSESQSNDLSLSSDDKPKLNGCGGFSWTEYFELPVTGHYIDEKGLIHSVDAESWSINSFISSGDSALPKQDNYRIIRSRSDYYILEK